MKQIAMWILVLTQSCSAWAIENFIPPTGLGRLVFENLDLKSFRSSFGPKAPEIRTLNDQVKQHCPKAKVSIDESLVKVQCFDWYYEVRILSRGDFNGDGLEDLRLDFTDRAIGASYSSRTVVTVTRQAPNKMLEFAGLKAEAALAR